jgi:hypothetical protein
MGKKGNHRAVCYETPCDLLLRARIEDINALSQSLRSGEVKAGPGSLVPGTWYPPVLVIPSLGCAKICINRPYFYRFWRRNTTKYGIPDIFHLPPLRPAHFWASEYRRIFPNPLSPPRTSVDIACYVLRLETSATEHAQNVLQFPPCTTLLQVLAVPSSP